MQKHLVIAILILGLVLCGILVLICLAPGVDNAAGIAHPQYESMRAGGDGLARIEPIKALAFAFQVVVLAQFACFIALGVSEQRRDPTFYGLMAACYVITVVVWWQLFARHQAFLASAETSYFLGFPTATAWVVYGIYLAGVTFIGIYVFGFKRYIWSDEDQQKFDQLLAENQNN